MVKTCMLFITVDKKSAEKKISEMLVKKRLAACVNTLQNVKSVYRWKGKTERAKEYLMIAKAKMKDRAAIIKEVKKIHPYTVPEIIFFDIKGGNKDYLNWIIKETIK